MRAANRLWLGWWVILLAVVPWALSSELGVIAEAQGIVHLRPAGQQRWTPVGAGCVLQPGDWLRADGRGANALQVRLADGTELILGPGAQLELSAPVAARLDAGELRLTSPARFTLNGEVLAPGTVIVRAGAPLVRLEQPPLWLRNFSGSLARESLGSLIATVDGRNVPLTVGYHKVTVDIRDQLARTVIEESFVNHTNGQLEGIFHFPLPADASISDFGMWIGNELVTADVVERQRATEIFETILRERRDPALLEWAGGNLFKARVFPIPARGEKRITLTYTQALPRLGREVRYRYPLRSDLLRQHPLRELAITVRLASADPLAAVNCLSHPVRAQHTAHAASLEYSAREVTPERDFELAYEVTADAPALTVLPHRRGDDGYFMLFLNPPAAATRPLVADGAPLALVLLADTSASMDDAQRRAQDAFLASLLGALGPADRFALAAADVDLAWWQEGLQPATPEHVAAARAWLAERPALGWTDLPGAFAKALAQAAPGTHLVYLGDGIPATGEIDAAACARELTRQHGQRGVACHAVATGSTFEAPVMQAIGGLGGGSWRTMVGPNGPRDAALALLAELTAPALRDLAVEFAGLKVARVYPERLPNLPAGTQQLVVGRFLPQGAEQRGTVTVRGTLGGREQIFTAPLALAQGEEGNSFIPRLWARHHLEALLAQGSTEAIREQIIALGEEFHLMTPYTSLLVLESDADRERFKVQRRLRLRDGELFFAEGRAAATLELRADAMRQAGTWRTSLRRRAQARIEELARRHDGAEPGGGRDHAGALSTSGFHSADDEVEVPPDAPSDYRLVDERTDAIGPQEHDALVDTELPRGIDFTLSRRRSFDSDRAYHAPANEWANLEFSDGYVQGFNTYRQAHLLTIAGFGSRWLTDNPYLELYRQPEPLPWLKQLAVYSPIPATSGDRPSPAWSAEALEVAARLKRHAPGSFAGSLRCTTEQFLADSRGSPRRYPTRSTTLLTAGSWVMEVTDSAEGLHLLAWSADRQCGQLNLALGIGSVSPTLDGFITDLHATLSFDLAEEYGWARAEVRHPQPDRVLLVLTWDDGGGRAEFKMDARRDSSTDTAHIAYFVFDSLGRRDRAIAMLQEAAARGRLDLNARDQLASDLLQSERYSEAIGVLTALIEEAPADLAYRIDLMRAYHGDGDQGKLEATRAATEAMLKERRQWQHGNVAELGKACLATKLYAHAVACYEAAIAELQRQRVTDAYLHGLALDDYYQSLATAYAGLGETAKAVEAASGAIVVSGSNDYQREGALNHLASILDKVEDLAGYAAELDRQVAASGQERPVVRHALGQAFLARGDAQAAIPQLELARQYQPHDEALHELLADAYGEGGTPAGAIAAQFAWARSFPRGIGLWENLANLYDQNQRPADAERALTSIVETQPLEAAAHQRLAELREQRKQLEAALPHWQRVAELRRLEPTGLLGLANAQLRLKRYAEARATVQKLLQTTWPDRFQDTLAQAENLLQQINQADRK